MADGPYGGTPIQVGEDEVGQILDCPIPKSGPWQLAGIQDFSLAQFMYQLTLGELQFPRIPSRNHYLIPVTILKYLIIQSPLHHSRIECWRWPDKTKAPSAPFKIHNPPINPVPTYPTLWAHDADQERCMEVEPDSEAVPLKSKDYLIEGKINRGANAVWQSATRLHINRNFRYNSQSLTVSSTPRPVIGGFAWPSIIFPEASRELWEDAYTVWGNSTLGVFCYWWHSSRQQGGRGNITIKEFPALPTLDLRALSDAQLAAASRIFEDHKHLPMLPINQIDEDENRAELDRRLFIEVLGLPAELCVGEDSPLALLRRKLAAEPSIHGGKKSKVVL